VSSLRENTTVVSYLGRETLGGLLGGVFVVKQAKRLTHPFWAMGMTIVLAAFLGRIFLSVTELSWLIGALILSRNAIIPVMNACNDTVWQKSVDSGAQGRVFGARRLAAQGLFPVGVLLGPLLSEFLFKGSVLNEWTGSSIASLFFVLGFFEIGSVALLKNQKEPSEYQRSQQTAF